MGILSGLIKLKLAKKGYEYIKDKATKSQTKPVRKGKASKT